MLRTKYVFKEFVNHVTTYIDGPLNTAVCLLPTIDIQCSYIYSWQVVCCRFLIINNFVLTFSIYSKFAFSISQEFSNRLSKQYWNLQWCKYILVPVPGAINALDCLFMILKYEVWSGKFQSSKEQSKNLYMHLFNSLWLSLLDSDPA